MTLPFISYGGSSLLALGLGMGFLLAATRRRPVADLDDPGGGRMSAAALHPARGRRHGRPSLSRRGAGRGARRRAASRSSSRPTAGRSKYGEDFPARAIHAFPSATTDGGRRARQGARRADARRGRRRGAREAQPHQAARGGRLRRLSDGAAAARRLAPRRPDRAARAERGAGARQPVPEPARQPWSPAAFPSLRASTRRPGRRSARPAIRSARRSSPPPQTPYPDFVGGACACW